MSKIIENLRFIAYKIFPFLERYHTTRQFIKFCIVGVSNLIVDFIVYIILTRLFGIYFVAANIFSFSVAVSWSFYWNKRWTFQHEERKYNKQYVKFFITNFFGIIIQTGLLYVLVSNFGWFDVWAKIVAVIVASVWNFLTTKFWAFK